MKNIISILILFAFGCGKTEVETETQRLEEENRRLEAELNEPKRYSDAVKKNKKLKEDLLKRSVVGSYEHKLPDRSIAKIVLFENGKDVTYKNGEKFDEGVWKIVGNKVHVVEEGVSIDVLKIEPNGDLTLIADIRSGKRTEFPNEDQFTWKKVKE